MQNKKQEIKQENKKALPKLFLIMLIAALIGFVVGTGIALLGCFSDIEAMKAALNDFWAASAPWLLPVFALLLLVPSSVLYFGQKKAFAGWDGEDEAVLNKIESRISVMILLSGVFMILLYFGLAVMLSSMEVLSGRILLLCLAELIVSLFWSSVLQQKAVDLEKQINPEKRGSVYDLKFAKKWEDSCDEREKMIIYKSAYLAYKTTSRFCIGLSIVLMLGSLPFGYGPLPAGAVLLVWLVQLVRYCVAAMKLEKQ